MDEELEKVKKRVEKRLAQFDRNDNNGGAPFNDAMDHLGRLKATQPKTFRKSI